MSESDGVGVITLFVESRARRGSDGDILSDDRSLAGRGWQKDLREHKHLRLALRVDEKQRDIKGNRVDGDVIALPHFVGIRAMIRRLPRLVAAVDEAVKGSDVVVVKLPGIIGLIAVSRARRRRKPIAVQVVGDITEVLRSGVAGRPGQALAPVAARAVRSAVKRGRIVRYVTERVLQERYPASASAAVFAFSDVHVELPADLGSHARVAGRVIAVGSQEQPYKGHQILIEAVAALAGTHPWIHLELVGGGRYQTHLRHLADARNISDRIRFVGHVEDRDELLGHLDAAEVFAMPSLTEGLPRALVEAFARGLPCIGSNVGGIPELLPPEALAPAGDIEGLTRILGRALDDAAFRERLRLLARETTSRFLPDVLEARRREWSASFDLLSAPAGGTA